MHTARDFVCEVRKCVSSASSATDGVVHLLKCAESAATERGWSETNKLELIVQALNILAVLKSCRQSDEQRC